MLRFEIRQLLAELSFDVALLGAGALDVLQFRLEESQLFAQLGFDFRLLTVSVLDALEFFQFLFEGGPCDVQALFIPLSLARRFLLPKQLLLERAELIVISQRLQGAARFVGFSRLLAQARLTLAQAFFELNRLQVKPRG